MEYTIRIKNLLFSKTVLKLGTFFPGLFIQYTSRFLMKKRPIPLKASFFWMNKCNEIIKIYASGEIWYRKKVLVAIISEFWHIKNIHTLTLKFWNKQNEFKKETFTYCSWKTPHSIQNSKYQVTFTVTKYVKHYPDRLSVSLKFWSR